MEAELRELCERLRNAFDYMDAVDSDYARQVAREIADGILDTLAAQAVELGESQRQLAAYRRAINKMDDRIEYWKTEFSRAEIHGFMQELTAELAQPYTALADSDAGGGA